MLQRCMTTLGLLCDWQCGFVLHIRELAEGEVRKCTGSEGNLPKEKTEKRQQQGRKPAEKSPEARTRERARAFPKKHPVLREGNTSKTLLIIDSGFTHKVETCLWTTFQRSKDQRQNLTNTRSIFYTNCTCLVSDTPWRGTVVIPPLKDAAPGRRKTKNKPN